jgi:hypothetical protein
MKKNMVGRKLAKTWLGNSLIRVGQKVDEVWMTVGQYLVRNWSAFKAKEVGQKLDESWMDFGIENCVRITSKFRQFGGYKVGQLLGETCVDLGPFYLEISLAIQPLSFITHSLIVHNKRVQDKWLDVPELFLYVVLPDQNL